MQGHIQLDKLIFAPKGEKKYHDEELRTQLRLLGPIFSKFIDKAQAECSAECIKQLLGIITCEDLPPDIILDAADLIVNILLPHTCSHKDGRYFLEGISILDNTYLFRSMGSAAVLKKVIKDAHKNTTSLALFYVIGEAYELMKLSDTANMSDLLCIFLASVRELVIGCSSLVPPFIARYLRETALKMAVHTLVKSSFKISDLEGFISRYPGCMASLLQFALGEGSFNVAWQSYCLPFFISRPSKPAMPSIVIPELVEDKKAAHYAFIRLLIEIQKRPRAKDLMNISLRWHNSHYEDLAYMNKRAPDQGYLMALSVRKQLYPFIPLDDFNNLFGKYVGTIDKIEKLNQETAVAEACKHITLDIKAFVREWASRLNGVLLQCKTEGEKEVVQYQHTIITAMTEEMLNEIGAAYSDWMSHCILDHT